MQDDLPPDDFSGWFVPLPGPDVPQPSPTPITYHPLAEIPQDLPNAAQGLTAVSVQHQDPLSHGARAVAPAAAAGWVISAIAGGITYDLVKAGAGYLLDTPNVSLSDRPAVLYSQQHQMTFHLQSNGSYSPSGQVIF
jgi:hypothetical protein